VTRRRSALYARFLEDYAACREAFEEYRAAAYATAEEATRGRLLSRRGIAAKIEPYSLFLGNEATANAYASEELREHWTTHPRPVYERFERQWVEQWV
jgi:sirohydrochlorin ferrochelatase